MVLFRTLTLFLFEYLSVSEMESIQEFPGNCGMDPSETLGFHHSAWMETYEYVFGQILTQHSLGILE